MDTSLLSTKPGSETVAANAGKTDRARPASGKVDKAPASKRDRKAAPVTKDTETAAQEPMVTTEVPVTVIDPEPTDAVTPR